jgi:UDP-N-acetylmuramyl-tripeptide synthetase
LTRDHLDFHVDMEAYYQAKRLLFTEYLRAGSAAVILVDQAQGPAGLWGLRLQADLQGLEPGRGLRVLTCGLDPGCDIAAQHCRFGIEQTTATITVHGHEIPLSSNLIGAFNLKNILGAVGVASGLGLSPTVIGQGLATTIRVPGRLEKISIDNELKHPAVFVDYAHTPDALENVLVTLRQLSPQRLLVVFGCGGDRDPGKRQIMGEIAGRLADVAIITADNSRSESTAAIMAQIEQGVLTTGKQALDPQAPAPVGYLAISNRAEAIVLALQLAKEGDIVLISGKGHENYQLSATGSIFFDDRLEAIRGLGKRDEQ